MIILEGGASNYILANGRKYSYFGGNNYLGLANNPDVKAASIRAIKKYGINFSASRVTTGTSTIHLELEEKLSAFKGKEDTVVFASGYQGNSILLEILKEKYSVILADELCHASINSAIPRNKESIYFRHCDAQNLAFLLESKKISSPLVITDGVFALTGEIAPLGEIYSVVKKFRGMLVVDDAHSTGILGETGKGTPEYFGIHSCRDIYQTETMSKALGSYGGFISGSRKLIDQIRHRSSTYQASTALPPPVVAAALESLKIISESSGLRTKLLKRAVAIKGRIAAMGFKTVMAETPVVPVFMQSASRAGELSEYLEKNGIIAPFMNYPSGREMNLIRIAVTSDHTDNQIDMLLNNLGKWTRKYGSD